MKLTASTRKAMPAKDFAGPDRSFPVENKAHARAALSGASRAEHAGHISMPEEKRIDRRADTVLGKAGKHLREMHGRK